MLQMLQRLQALFGRHERTVERLSLSGRGSWRADLDGGVVIELGRGSAEDVLARASRFVDTITQVTGHFKAPVLHADLRHPDGYAVRLRNVTIASPAAAPRRN
jgi:cell division protein FtsQ